MLLTSAFIALLSGATFTTTELDQVVENTQHKIEQYYVEDDLIAAINASLSAPTLVQTLQQAKTRQDAADALTAHLKQFDAHFTVQYVEPDAEPGAIKENWFAKLARKNFGFREVKVLEGNVGLLEFWGFADANHALKAKVAAVMDVLADVDALIIDLRQNGGGSGETVQWLSSYFMDGKVHLNSFYTRYTDAKQEFWTAPEIDIDHFERIPIYVLTSKNTFSAAEEFTYNLKHLGRATIVGEQTKGGANPWRWFALEHGFRIGIPTTKAINPVTQTNWEGKGVQPHIAVSADDALDEAYRSALQTILERAKTEFERRDIEAQLKRLSVEE